MLGPRALTVTNCGSAGSKFKTKGVGVCRDTNTYGYGDILL